MSDKVKMSRRTALKSAAAGLIVAVLRSAATTTARWVLLVSLVWLLLATVGGVLLLGAGQDLGSRPAVALLAGLDLPTSGDVLLDGESLSGLDEDGRAALRARRRRQGRRVVRRARDLQTARPVRAAAVPARSRCGGT